VFCWDFIGMLGFDKRFAGVLIRGLQGGPLVQGEGGEGGCRYRGFFFFLLHHIILHSA
jgi:hypothetical protein